MLALARNGEAGTFAKSATLASATNRAGPPFWSFAQRLSLRMATSPRGGGTVLRGASKLYHHYDEAASLE